ncbi:sensor histidine kinase [Sporolactobacillus vineae]|uniref:sensor histidine kinase n=1 Tax=Sporolactobacillus vineae TaxID=444463 RepID=UPI0002884019|nr:sensor histidine kinase [Sporolactobacillus vineae]
MACIYRILIFALIALGLARGTLTSLEVMCFLALLILDVLRTRFFPEKVLAWAEWLLALAFCFVVPVFIAAGALLLPDIVAEKHGRLIGAALIVVPAAFFLSPQQLALDLLYLAVCLYLTVLTDRLARTEARFKQVTDEERRSIYELEKSRQLLRVRQEENIHLAELKERNRIARELHDTVGHRIASLYMQLQAAYKIRTCDRGKYDELVAKTIDELSGTLRLIHDTAHDLIPRKPTGLDTLRELVKSFTYCPVTFNFSGHTEEIAADQWRVLTANVREALTNVFKHSEATAVRIELTQNRRYIRMLIHDNGKGAPVLNQQLGLTGMRERVKAMGGSLTIDGSAGFTIVCLLPKNRKEGGLFETPDRR